MRQQRAMQAIAEAQNQVVKDEMGASGDGADATERTESKIPVSELPDADGEWKEEGNAGGPAGGGGRKGRGEKNNEKDPDGKKAIAKKKSLLQKELDGLQGEPYWSDDVIWSVSGKNNKGIDWKWRFRDY